MENSTRNVNHQCWPNQHAEASPERGQTSEKSVAQYLSPFFSESDSPTSQTPSLSCTNPWQSSADVTVTTNGIKSTSLVASVRLRPIILLGRDLHQLLQASPKHVRLDRLEAAWFCRYGRRLECGHRSLLGLLHDVDFAVEVRGSGPTAMLKPRPHFAGALAHFVAYHPSNVLKFQESLKNCSASNSTPSQAYAPIESAYWTSTTQLPPFGSSSQPHLSPQEMLTKYNDNTGSRLGDDNQMTNANYPPTGMSFKPDLYARGYASQHKYGSLSAIAGASDIARGVSAWTSSKGPLLAPTPSAGPNLLLHSGPESTSSMCQFPSLPISRDLTSSFWSNVPNEAPPASTDNLFYPNAQPWSDIIPSACHNDPGMPVNYSRNLGPLVGSEINNCNTSQSAMSPWLSGDTSALLPSDFQSKLVSGQQTLGTTSLPPNDVNPFIPTCFNQLDDPVSGNNTTNSMHAHVKSVNPYVSQFDHLTFPAYTGPEHFSRYATVYSQPPYVGYQQAFAQTPAAALSADPMYSMTPTSPSRYPQPGGCQDGYSLPRVQPPPTY